MYYIVGVPKSYYPLYNGGTQKSLSTIQWGYPKAITYYIMEGPKTQYVPYSGGTQKSLFTI